jgi:hypothetical protein
MSPVKKIYAHEMEHWIRRNDGKVVTVYQVVEFFGSAYLRIATAESAVVGVKQRAFARNINIFRQQDLLSDDTSLTKNSASWTIDQNRPRMSKEFDPLLTSAQIMTPIRAAMLAFCLF